MYNSGQVFQIDSRRIVFVGNSDKTYASGGVSSIPFKIPAEARMIAITLVGSGGGGAGGQSGSAGTARYGGGGGGCGAVHNTLYRASDLPKTIYINLPGCSDGGTPGIAGTTADAATISICPVTAVTAISIIARAASGLASSNQTGSSPGAAPSVTGAYYIAMALSNNGQSFSSIGGAGGSGSSGAVGGSVTLGTLVCGGAAGGGVNATPTDRDGGAIMAPNTQDNFITPGSSSITLVPGATGTGVNGNCGLNFLSKNITGGANYLPIFCTGGSGASGNNSGTGGKGGDGAPGCGGGGGGAGVTGGNGGRGGPSFCYIEWY